MDASIALFSVAVGYLTGSLSFARIVTRIAAPEIEITGIEYELSDRDETMHVEAIAGTAVEAQLGSKLGCLTGILDILKVLIPTLTFKLVYPESSYYLITAGMGLVGHNWPLYHRFKGGRGISAIYGGFFVLDSIGIIFTSILGMVLGLSVLRNVLVAYTAGVWLMIPWIWLRTHDPAQLAYVMFCNLILIIAMIPEIRSISAYLRSGGKMNYEASIQMTPMGRGITEFRNRLGQSKKP
jgi:glycerol-3-phosphate acyltransferase PlsY